jgi:hypothetical protein
VSPWDGSQNLYKKTAKIIRDISHEQTVESSQIKFLTAEQFCHFADYRYKLFNVSDEV